MMIVQVIFDVKMMMVTTKVKAFRELCVFWFWSRELRPWIWSRHISIPFLLAVTQQ